MFQKGDWTPLVFFGGLAFFGFHSSLFWQRLNYSRTEYRFFSDRLEFEEGFFSRNRKVVEYRDVKEVTLREGILQKRRARNGVLPPWPPVRTQNNPFFALGFGNVSASGIACATFKRLPIYEKVRKLVDTARSSAPTLSPCQPRLRTSSSSARRCWCCSASSDSSRSSVNLPISYDTPCLKGCRALRTPKRIAHRVMGDLAQRQDHFHVRQGLQLRFQELAAGLDLRRLRLVLRRHAAHRIGDAAVRPAPGVSSARSA